MPFSPVPSAVPEVKAASINPPEPQAAGLPAWFVVPVVLGLSLMATTIVIGTVLADMGFFRPLTLVPLVVVATAVLLWWALPLPTWSSRQRLSSFIVALALLLAVGSSLFNGYFASEHLLTNRDPGVYNTTAAYLASNGKLRVDTDRFEVFGGVPGLKYGTLGYPGNVGEEVRPKLLYPQFLHGLPVLLAVGDWLGGSRLMLRLPAVFGALGLLSFFAVAQLWVRRWLALLAMATMALSLPQVWFSRDAFSEIPSQALVLGALWLTVEALRRRQTGLGLVAGFLLGATVALRIDAWALLVFVPTLVALTQLAWSTASARRTAVRFAIGVIPGTAVGTLDLFWRSAWYARNLSDQYTKLAGGVVALSVLLVLLVKVVNRYEGIQDWWSRVRHPTALFGGALATTLLVVGYLVRPSLQTMRGGRATGFVESLQQAAGQPLDGTRMYGENSLVWQSWYIGRVPLLVAFIGLGLLVWLFLSGRKREYGLLLAMLLPMTTMYLYKPSINPDQLWAMRRFLITALPLLVLAAAHAFQQLADWLWKQVPEAAPQQTLGRALVAAAAVVLLWVPLGRLQPVVAASSQDHVLGLVESSCEVLPDNAAVVVITEANLQHTTVALLRSFCDVPVAWAPVELGPARWKQTAEAIRANGHTPVVLAQHIGTIRLIDPEAKELASFATASPNQLEQFLGVPDELFEITYKLAFAELTL